MTEKMEPVASCASLVEHGPVCTSCILQSTQEDTIVYRKTFVQLMSEEADAAAYCVSMVEVAG